MTTFKDLNERTSRTERCPICGDILPGERAVRLNIQASKSTGRPQTEWLYRRATTMCESCAVRAVDAAVTALSPFARKLEEQAA